jgi:hypothetical protein
MSTEPVFFSPQDIDSHDADSSYSVSQQSHFTLVNVEELANEYWHLKNHVIPSLLTPEEDEDFEIQAWSGFDEIPGCSKLVRDPMHLALVCRARSLPGYYA